MAGRTSRAGYERIDGKNNNETHSVLIGVLYVAAAGFVVWLILLSFIYKPVPTLNPVINDVSFAPVSVDISKSIGNGERYQYVGVVRDGVAMIDSITTPAHALPRFSDSRTAVIFPANFTFQRGDVIVHQYYTGPDIMFASLLAQTSKIYQNQCLVNVKNTSIPYCWNRTTQTYCETPRIGITGPILSNVPQYFANRSNQLKLDPTNGCYYTLVQFEQTFRILFPDIVVMPNNLTDCFIFGRDTWDSRFFLPSVWSDVNLFVSSDPTVAAVSAFINFGNVDDPDVYIHDLTEIYSRSWDQYLYNTGQTNVTICGYVQALSTYYYVPKIDSRLDLGANAIYQWGNLGLEELSLYHDNRLQYMAPIDRQPSFATLKSIPHFLASFEVFGSGVDPTNLFNWDMSRIESFFGLFYSYDFTSNPYPQIDTFDVSSGKNFTAMFNSVTMPANITLSNWNMSKAVSVNDMFNAAYFPSLNVTGWRFRAPQTSFQSTFANFYLPNIVDVSLWNPTLVSNLDKFATGSYVYPNITLWNLRTDVCANDMINGNYVVDTPLYDALLIKFDAQTTSRNCVWTNTQVPRSNASDVAFNNLCNRGWSIQDTGGFC